MVTGGPDGRSAASGADGGLRAGGGPGGCHQRPHGSNETYGSSRMHAEKAEGVKVGRHRRVRLMRRRGLKAPQKSRYGETTGSHHDASVAPDPLDQNLWQPG